MELYHPLFDDDGNVAVNPDGTLACRPFTEAETAAWAAEFGLALTTCDYCSAPLALGSTDVACAECQAKVDEAKAEADHAAWVAERDEHDALMEAEQAADLRQAELDDAAADLAYEYSSPEYGDYDWGEPESWDDGG